ncbi:MAG: DUF3109 family protein [Saprospiraceae bacterium]|nr:DUF3109 family protein [Saprospiraceae bacterium]
MLLVQDKLISDDIITEHFVCNLDACKGACCWEGDFGAPLEDEELQILDDIYPIIKHLLSKEGIAAIEASKPYTYFDEPKEYGTTLVNGGACAFLIYEKNGIAKCAIEKAYEQGLIDFYKPISCHLYPIRVELLKKINSEALNYDRWDICATACTNGKSLKVPVYQFVKNALIRKYGEDFYAELETVAKEFVKR